MSDDLRIIEELEKELGVKIGRLEGEKTESVFYRADAKGNVVQLSLKIVGLGTFPLLITQLQNLTQLVLRSNELKSLPAKIAQLQNLTRLNLWNNELKSLPAKIAQLQNLTRLNLWNNELKSLPAEITQLQNLTRLNLWSNELKSLPAEITQLRNLTQLDLRNNGLKSLPAEIVQLQNLTQLDLRNNELKSLPAEIVQLQNLTQLDLGNNGLKSLPAEIAQLQNLTRLNLWSNGLKSLPAEIAQLQNLTRLNLWSNGLKSLPAEIVQLQNLTQLDLGNNELKSLPAEITQLQNLTRLNLWSNELKSLPAEIAQLQNLTQLVLRNNELKSLPAEITQLRNLTQLDLRNNELKSLPAEIAQLQNLTQLDLRNNGLKSLPAEIAQLQNLTQLVLRSNELKSLPAEIVQLQNLTQLDLGNNGLKSLPAEIAQLQNLTQLDLGNNGLKSLPAEIAQLQNLTRLNLWSNGLKSLPAEIVQLQNLTQLDLGNNGLKSLPAEIVQLQNLTQLDLGNNELKSLPAEITQLQNLTQLVLRNNELKSLPAEIVQLQNLTQLDLGNNGLESLPQEILQLKRLEYLGLDENPLQQPPPEIVEQGLEAIFAYLRELSAEVQAQVVNEAKLLLVGQGDVGKTCLAKRLVYNTFQDEESTEGIDILSWSVAAPIPEQENIQLNVWDFGGQEIYHATHQFFLTKRSVYLLVWNARKTKDYEHIHYWLHTIEAFGENSPVILVLSKCKERDDDLNMKDLKEQFPNITNLYKVDSEDRTGIDALTDVIRQTAWQLPHMQTPWIPAWFKVRERLERLENDARNWIEYTEYQDICQAEGLDEKQTNILDEYLHQLGVIVHFRDRRLNLRNMVVLKPEWATHAVYRVLDNQSVRKRGGVLLHSELGEVWDSQVYPPHLYPNLLELMNEFELAYELPDKRSHLVAELLPSTEPNFEWNETENLRFFYRYDFLPASLISRFIVQVHQDLEPRSDGSHLCWREGAVLLREDSRSFVKVRPVEKTIEIKVHGNKKRELLAIIRNRFDHIHRSIKKIEIVEEIPCPCSEGCSHRFNYKQLLNAERQRIEKVQCPAEWRDVSLSSLLDGYEREEERREKKERGEDSRPKIEVSVNPQINIDPQIHVDPKIEQRNDPQIHVDPKIEQRNDPQQDVTRTQVIVQEDKEKPKKWYQTGWAIIVGLGVLITLALASVQLHDRFFGEQQKPTVIKKEAK